MDEYIEIINQIDDILNTSENIENENDKRIFLQQNLNTFENFKDSLIVILRQYQFIEQKNNEQNIQVQKVRNAISRLLQMKDVFEEDSRFAYYKSELLDAINYNENRFAFNLQYETSIDKVKSALQYLDDRKNYISILEENNMFSEQGLNESSANEYKVNNYEQNMFGHSLMLLKSNFLNLEKEDVIEILQHIDNSDFFNSLITKQYDKMNFYEQNLIYQYSDTILKMKSIFAPDELKNDKMIIEMWNGNVMDNKTLKNIIQNISPKSFKNLLGFEEKSSEKGFINDLSSHFKDVNLSNKNIGIIMKSIIESNEFDSEIAEFLAEIDIPTDYSQFKNSKHFDAYDWIEETETFESLKSFENNIENAFLPFLPSKYYLKKIDKLNECPDINSHFVDNLITLLHSDYYSLEEKTLLTNALKQQNLYNKYITEEDIVFDEKDSIENTILKVKQAYYSGKPIPLELAKNLLNDDLSKKISIDKETLQACIQGVVCNTLLDKGVDIQNKVFFGKSDDANGYDDAFNKSIWLNDSLLEAYLNSQTLIKKTRIFQTMFHEMRHTIQEDDMDKGKMDYLTYNFIKEKIIEDYDKDYYSENYTNFFMESDARKEQIIGALGFLNEMNPNFVKVIKDQMEDNYISERENHTIYGDSKKKISIGKDNFIDVSNYVGMLIQNNPIILTNNPILNIEYNPNGSKKSIEEMINNFEEQKDISNSDYKNLYSIYYGIVSKDIENSPIEDENLMKKINLFMAQQQELISMEDRQNLYHTVDKKDNRQVYTRLYDITRPKKNDVSDKNAISKNNNNDNIDTWIIRFKGWNDRINELQDNDRDNYVMLKEDIQVSMEQAKYDKIDRINER